jgi:hypothetical protein
VRRLFTFTERFGAHAGGGDMDGNVHSDGNEWRRVCWCSRAKRGWLHGACHHNRGSKRFCADGDIDRFHGLFVDRCGGW